jgi:GTP 3',8-cyclase
MNTRSWASDRLRLIVTNECNIGCFYCHNEGQSKGNTYMSDALAHHVEALIAFSGEPLDAITFSGGEPLLHPKLPDLITRFSNYSPSRTLVTNGILLSTRMLTDLQAAGLTKIRLGIDSLVRAKSRPTPGNIHAEPITAVVERVLDSGIDLELNCVITKFNVNEIGDILAYCIHHNIAAKFFEHVEVRSFGTSQSIASMIAHPTIAFETVHDTFLAVADVDRHGYTTAFSTANYSYFVGEIEYRYCRYLCPFGLCSLTGTRIDAEGYVYTCMSSRGNLILDPTAELGESLAVVRSAVRTGCVRASQEVVQSSSTVR